MPLPKIIVHINRAKIDRNRKYGFNDPVLSCKYGRNDSPTYGNEVDILDKSGNKVGAVVHRPKQPLPCGARVWLELDPEFLNIEIKDT